MFLYACLSASTEKSILGFQLPEDHKLEAIKSVNEGQTKLHP